MCEVCAAGAGGTHAFAFFKKEMPRRGALRRGETRACLHCRNFLLRQAGGLLRDYEKENRMPTTAAPAM